MNQGTKQFVLKLTNAFLSGSVEAVFAELKSVDGQVATMAATADKQADSIISQMDELQLQLDKIVNTQKGSIEMASFVGEIKALVVAKHPQQPQP